MRVSPVGLLAAAAAVAVVAFAVGTAPAVAAPSASTRALPLAGSAVTATSTYSAVVPVLSTAGALLAPGPTRAGTVRFDVHTIDPRSGRVGLVRLHDGVRSRSSSTTTGGRPPSAPSRFSPAAPS